MRAFIAINLTSALREKIGAVIDDFKRSGADVKWVKPENIHLTLKFLGDADEPIVNAVSGALMSVSQSASAFTLDVKEIGCFPNLRNPRVIWVGLKGDEKLALLQSNIEDALEKCEIAKDTRKFSAHITIGRVRSLDGYKRLKPMLAEHENDTIGTLNVNDISLMQSVLKPDGPIYTLIKAFPL
ncbi:2',5' RNA ligase [Candidatus Magnetoovum chiemensis]|nr:2',5' RNA ligase [Candidatus Magnetoovum chiemensis]